MKWAFYHKVLQWGFKSLTGTIGETLKVVETTKIGRRSPLYGIENLECPKEHDFYQY